MAAAFLATSLAACGGGSGGGSPTNAGGGGESNAGTDTGTGSDTNGDSNAGTGSDEGTYLSGVAATGAPIIGTVCVMSQAGEECVAINEDGSFRIETTGKNGPFILAAKPSSGTAQNQYSWSQNTTGTVNVTPFTTLAMAMASDYANIEDWYAAWNTHAGSINQAKINEAVSAILEYFKDALQGAVNSEFNPFSTPFEANGQGIDGVYDGLEFVYDWAGGTVTLNGNAIDISLEPGVSEFGTTGALSPWR